MQAAAAYTTTPTSSGGNIIGKLLVIVFIAAAAATAYTMTRGQVEAVADEDAWTTFEPVELGAVAVVIDPSYSHADERHPTEAPAARRCFDKRGAYQSFLVSREMKRYLRVCLDDDGRFYFQIVDKIKNEYWERTAYLRHELKTTKDLDRYTWRNGYSRFKGTIK